MRSAHSIILVLGCMLTTGSGNKYSKRNASTASHSKDYKFILDGAQAADHGLNLPSNKNQAIRCTCLGAAPHWTKVQVRGCAGEQPVQPPTVLLGLSAVTDPGVPAAHQCSELVINPMCIYPQFGTYSPFLQDFLC